MEAQLIANGTIVTWGTPNQVIEDGAVLIMAGKIAEIGSRASLEAKYPDATRLDAGQQLVMPGNICAHTHFYGAFARGMAIPGTPPKDFPEILEKLWWRLDRALTLEDVKYSALVSVVDAIKHGTTTLIDHHASPQAIAGSLTEIAHVVESAGVRAALCYEVTDRNGREGANAGIAENIAFAQTMQSERPLLRALFGLHASLTLSDETLAACVQANQALDLGFHIHVAEHEADEYDAIDRYGKRVVERLADAGILNDKTIVAHAIHVDALEKQLLAESGCWVTHQPRSNMNNGVGAADVEGMLRLGIPVCLGNDGMGNVMWSEWKSAYLLQKVVHRDPRRMNGMDIVQMGIEHNSQLASQLWGIPMGRLEVGGAADIIFVDYQPTTPFSAGNLPWHILFGFESSMVTTTMVAGKLLMHQRQLLTLNEVEITARSRTLAQQVWTRLETGH